MGGEEQQVLKVNLVCPFWCKTKKIVRAIQEEVFPSPPGPPLPRNSD